MPVQSEKSFTLICPKCGARSLVGLSELPSLRVRYGVVGWNCQVCEYHVEMATLQQVRSVKTPRRLNASEKARLKGKGKK